MPFHQTGENKGTGCLADSAPVRLWPGLNCIGIPRYETWHPADLGATAFTVPSDCGRESSRFRQGDGICPAGNDPSN